MAEDDVIEKEVRIAARPETVFTFLVDPAYMVRWMGALALLDPRPGGTYRVAINERDVARGQYVEVVPHSRVVFTWGWEAPGNLVPPGSSTVAVTLRPEGEGTILRLVHRHVPAGVAESHRPSGFPRLMAPFMAAAVRRATRQDLARLKRLLEGGGKEAPQLTVR